MKFRKKPILIEAIQYVGTVESNREIIDWTRDSATPAYVDKYDPVAGNVLYINTLEGTFVIRSGDWVVKGVKGEFYPCDKEIFEMTYERVEE